MIFRSALCCAALLVFATSTWSADKPAPKKAAKATPKAAVKKHRKTAPRTHTKPHASTLRNTSLKPAPRQGLAHTTRSAVKPAFRPSPALHGPRETLTCRDGTEDRHARIGVVLIGGKVDSFAYYSKWKPRTCSIYLQRNRDGYSHWTDKGHVTSVSVERGLFMIEQNKGEYRFVFRDVDRERYCGMEGTINGTLTVRKGSERCELAGIMEEGVPLGQAVAAMEQASAAAAAATAAATATAAQNTAAASAPRPVSRSRTVAPWPSAAGGIGD